MDVARLRTEISDFLRTSWPMPEGVSETSFSAFNPRQVSEASRLARELSQTARAAGDDDAAVEAVLDQARAEAGRRLPALVKYALMIFLTHDPIGARVGPPP